MNILLLESEKDVSVPVMEVFLIWFSFAVAVLLL